MNFTTLANSRYTTKKYDPIQKVSAEKIEQLKEILRLSPSSINSQPWKFTIISDQALKAELAAVSYFNEQKIKDASHLVVFSSIDDISQFEKQISEHLPEGSVTYYNTFLKPLPETEIKSWLQSQVYLSLGFFLGACTSMDIDSSPMEGIQADKYAEILKLNGYKPLFAVAIGYRNPEDANQPSVKPKSRLEMDLIIDVI